MTQDMDNGYCGIVLVSIRHDKKGVDMIIRIHTLSFIENLKPFVYMHFLTRRIDRQF